MLKKWSFTIEKGKASKDAASVQPPLSLERNGEQQLNNTLNGAFIMMEITWNHLFPTHKLLFPQRIYLRLR